MDTAPLRDAYRPLPDAADTDTDTDTDTSSAPPPGEWDADQVLAPSREPLPTTG